MPENQINVDEINEVLIKRAIAFPAAEIYGGIAGIFDFGPIGTLIRQKIKELWRNMFIWTEENVFEIEGGLLLPEPVFKASGHLDTFHDPLVQCEKCKSMFRADHIVEDTTGERADSLSLEQLWKQIEEHEIKCPKCKGALTEPRQFNLMFETEVGATGGKKAYLRPETAQNIFLDFRRVSHAMRATLPFGIAQIGRSFRNEIAPRNYLVRMREFTQMEIEMFVHPEQINDHPYFYMLESQSIRLITRKMQTEENREPIEITVGEAVKQGLIPNQFMAYYIAKEAQFIEELGIPQQNYWFRELLEEETAHYSAANFDLEIQTPMGVIECIGNAYRQDYDLSKHSKHSKTKLTIQYENKPVVPHVIEPSFGLDRIFYILMLVTYQAGDRKWSWFKLPPYLAPYHVKVCPLQKKDGLPEAAREIFEELREEFDAIYDQTGSIGKRYARADEIGIPFSVTIDYETLEDETVTIRDRDSTEQVRIHIDDLFEVLHLLIGADATWEEVKESFSVESSKKDKKKTK